MSVPRTPRADCCAKHIAPNEVKRWMEENRRFLLLDVRGFSEYRREHIPGAVSLPVDQMCRSMECLGAVCNTPIVAYCSNGSRTARALRMLRKMGYRELYDMGTIDSWPYDVACGR